MMDESGRLPTFLIIGAMKAGTTSLHDYLNQHPDVFMSVQKELDFFILEKNWTRGLDWYKKQFPTDALAVGESSPNYTKSLIFGGVPQRIRAVIPNVKLIYILRDPIERLVSHYSHQFIDRKEFRSLDDIISDFDNNHYIDASLYGRQLSLYLGLFDTSQILVIRQEDLEAQPRMVLDQVFSFIGVDSQKFDFRETKSHKTSDKRRLTGLGSYVSKLPMGIRICNLFSGLCWEEFARPEFSDEQKKALEQYFSEDLEKLYKVVGEKFYF